MVHATRRVVLTLLLALALLATPHLLAAQARHLETPHPTPAIAVCDTLVDINTGERFHVEQLATTTNVAAGSTLTLSGAAYTVTAAGPVYHLDNGAVLQPTGSVSGSLKGQHWVELYPNSGAVVMSAGWSDNDRDGALSPGDALTIDGKEVRVTAVRLVIDVVSERR
jgi:hypothetical protein